MRLLRESVLLLALGLSLSSATAPGETSFKVRRGAYPWHVWKSPVYKQNFTWPEFRKEVAELNNLPNTEKAFRHLKRGTELKIPSLPGATASAADIAKAKEDQRAIDKAEFAADKAAFETEINRLKAALDRSYSVIYRNLWFWIFVIAALLLGSSLAYVLTRRHYDTEPDESEIRRLRGEVTHLRHALRESDARDHFLKQYTVPFEVPSDLGYVLGKTHKIYLLKAEPIDGEPAVYIHGHTMPIKLSNVKRYLYDASRHNPEVLSYYSISKKPQAAEVEDTEATRAL